MKTKLKLYLEMSGVSVSEFASLIGKEPNYVYQVLRGMPTSPKNAKIIEEKTHGMVSRLDTLYPEEFAKK